MTDLQLFGQIDLRDSEGHELSSVLAQPKRLAVLAYLAVSRPRGFQRRDKIVGLFWPELDQARARQALNKSVHHLRRFLGADVIESRGDDELSLNASLVRCDVCAFEDAVAAGRHLDALALYRGPFADGLFVVDAPEVEQWLSGERERLRGMAVAEARAESEASADRDSAVRWAERAVELAPLDEPAVRQLMTALARAGDVAGAVRRFDDFVRRLGSELSLAPSKETQTLRDQIARESSTVTEATDVTDRPAALPRRTQPLTPVVAEPAVVHATKPIRPKHARAWMAVVGSAIVAVAIIALVVTRRPAPSPAGVGAPRRVFILPIENRTGDASLALVGQMVSDWIVQGLTAANIAEVVAYGPNTGAPTVATARQFAKETGAQRAISGAFYKEGDSLRFQLQVIDAPTGRVFRVFRPVTAAPAHPDQALEPLRQQAMTILSEGQAPQFEVMLQGAPPTYDAYRAYMDGVELYAHREQERAFEQFKRAAQLDTSFVEAILGAATALEFIGGAREDSLIAVLSARRDALSPTLRLGLDELIAERSGNAVEWDRLTRELSRRLPTSFYPYRHANSLVALGRLHAAHDELRTIDPTTGWMSGWFAYWVSRVMIDHMLGDSVAVRADVAAGNNQYPANLAIGEAAAFRIGSSGTRAEMDSLLERATTLPPLTGWNAGSVFGPLGAEAAAHGRDDWVPEIRRRALAWYDALPAVERAKEAWPYSYTWMLYELQAWPELAARVTQMTAIAPHDPRRLAYEGIAAAQRGDAATAHRLSAELHERPLSRVEDFYDRARIAGMLGERDSVLVFLRAALASPAPEGATPYGLAMTVYLHSEPAFHGMINDPEFRRLLAPKD